MIPYRHGLRLSVKKLWQHGYPPLRLDLLANHSHLINGRSITDPQASDYSYCLPHHPPIDQLKIFLQNHLENIPRRTKT